MNRLFLLTAAAVTATGFAATPAVAGLVHNPSFSHRLTVRVPDDAQTVQLGDDHGRAVRPTPTSTRSALPRATRTVAPKRAVAPVATKSSARATTAQAGDDRRGPAASEPGDDHNRPASSGPGDDRRGSSTSEPGDDRRGPSTSEREMTTVGRDVGAR